jgi:hypothetical protein
MHAIKVVGFRGIALFCVNAQNNFTTWHTPPLTLIYLRFHQNVPPLLATMTTFNSFIIKGQITTSV